MTKPNSIDTDLVKQLAQLLDEAQLTEIDYASGDFRLRIVRQPAPQAVPAALSVGTTAAAPAPAAAAEADFATHPGAVKSPMVGTVYLSPQPGSAHFVRVGDTVSMGQTLLIIEAMKVMNQIRAPKSGKISRVLVSDAGPVEYGQVVMLIE
jgi:acetyl-CoA carboxylase biotin carboxyl carrier protein